MSNIISIQKISVSNGKIANTFQVEDGNDCCAFMGSTRPIGFSDLSNKYVTIRIDKDNFLSAKEIEFWCSKLIELDIDITYLGIERGYHILGYIITDAVYPEHILLMRFTMIRYLWLDFTEWSVKKTITTYEDYPEYDFWEIFMAHLACDSCKEDYDNTFSLTNNNTICLVSDKKMKSIMMYEARSRSFGGNINTAFSGEGFGDHKMNDPIEKILEEHVKK